MPTAATPRNPVVQFLRYFRAGIWTPDSSGGCDRSVWLRTPLFLLSLCLLRQEFARASGFGFRIAGIELTAHWRPAAWTYRIDRGTRLFRQSATWRW